MFIIQLTVTAIALNFPVDITFVISLCISLLFMFIGNYLGKLCRNFWAGIRTPWTLARADAHQYLLDHYSEFDFIWASPPCPTHSWLNLPLHSKGHIRYPDMRLYQEIIFLRQWCRAKWVVENVRPYYQPLIRPRTVIDRHLFWSNFYIPPTKIPSLGDTHDFGWRKLSEVLEIELPAFVEVKHRRLMLRDITRPEIGLHILHAAMREVKQEALL